MHLPALGLSPYLGPAPQCTREAAMHLPALGLSPYLSPAPQCTREAALHLPALGLSPYLDPTSQCHAGSCFASSCSRAFALSRSNFAVPRRKLLCIFLLSGFRPISVQLRSACGKLPCTFPLSGFRPIKNKENPALSASSQSGFFLFLALLNAYGHYTTLEVFSDSCL